MAYPADPVELRGLKKIKCEHRDKIYLYDIEDYTGRPHVEVWRCQECNHLVNVYVPPLIDDSA